MKVTLLPFVAALALLLSGGAKAEGEATLQGRVVNGTSGGGSVADVAVTLFPASPEAEGITTRTDPQGGFAFGLSLPQEAFTLAVRYQGVDYAETIEAGDVEPMEVYVYEPTTSAESLSVLLDHHIVEFRPGEDRLNIVNYVQVSNNSDRTVVLSPEAAEGSLFPVADGAERVEVVEGASHLSAAGARTGRIQALPPGEHKLLLAYDMPVQDEAVLFHKPIRYPTERAVFIISDADGRAESQQLTDVEEVENANEAFRLLNGADLAPGSVLEVRMDGFTAKPTTSRDFMWLPPIVGLVIAAGVGVMFYFIVRRRRAEATAAG